MKNKIKIFENEEFGSVRTLKEKNGRVVFCGSDIAKALGYRNVSDALIRHCKGIVKHDTLTNGGIQSLSFISEGDVTDLSHTASCRGLRNLNRGFSIKYFLRLIIPEVMSPTRICSSKTTSHFWKSRIKVFSVCR